MVNLDLKLITDFLSTQPISKAWIFGSFARGEENPQSDVDILVTFKEQVRIGLKFVQIINSLEKLLNRPVDLVEESSLLPWIKPIVEKEKILIYEGSER